MVTVSARPRPARADSCPTIHSVHRPRRSLWTQESRLRRVTRLGRSYFHLHLVSDATGETLIAVSRAAAAQYQGISAIEHVYPLVRTDDAARPRAVAKSRRRPGIVLYTLVEPRAREPPRGSLPRVRLPVPVGARSGPGLFQSYLGTASTQRPGAQHVLNADYFRRIDALNFTMMHDDGAAAARSREADVILVGVSRTSKTPTASISPIAASRPRIYRSCPACPPPAVLGAAQEAAGRRAWSRAPSGSCRSGRTAS